MNFLPPNILLSDVNITPAKDERVVRVLDEGRVSHSGTFSYTSKDGGSYDLIFSNTFSTFSSKYVGVAYTDKGKSYEESFTVPPGLYKAISVFAYPGQTINVNLVAQGGSGDDVNFFITTIECKQNVKFTFTLFNAGSIDGDVTVKLLADDKGFWSNNYILKSNEKITKSRSVLIPNCNDLRLIISEQKSTGYFGSSFKDIWKLLS